MKHAPRVAFFTDCFHEVNGVALTSRKFHGFAKSGGLPLLCVCPGRATKVQADGSTTMVELAPGPMSLGFEADLRFDLGFLRSKAILRRELDRFQPDLIHVTSPGHCGLLGAILAHELGLPLTASWHTNIHEFAARRLERLLAWAPRHAARTLAAGAEQGTLRLVLRFYQLARLLFAPNQELIDLLERATGKPVLPMPRGVDRELFGPFQRRRQDGQFVIGYVGRITAEKNVRLLAQLERALIENGVENYRFLVVGQGSERQWLQANLRAADFPGVLKGEQLAQAYADMDVFAFPSRTDTYGNVVQEALASGVPAVVTGDGGPKYLVQHGKSGFVARDDQEFFSAVTGLALNRHLHERMRQSACESIGSRSWDSVFEGVYRGYRLCF